ncbi:pheST operon leader peptide PheM [Yersinia entomophaga]
MMQSVIFRFFFYFST